MKFMIQMNVKQGPYQMTGWSPEDVKRMINYMHELNKDLKAKGQFVAAEGLVSPDQARIVKANDDGSPSVTDGRPSSTPPATSTCTVASSGAASAPNHTASCTAW